MSQSIKFNYFFNLVNTLAGMLFPLITFPYASRVMGADGIGQVNFFSSIVSYISLFTAIGIPIYAIREIARVRDDEREMSRTAVEILLLYVSLTVVGYVIVAVLCMTVGKIAADLPLFLLLSTSIFLTAIGCEWFYQGIEDFKYITVRGLCFRVLYVVLLFSLVRTKADLLLYAGLTVVGTVGNNVLNFLRLRRYVRVQLLRLRDLRPFRHFRPALRVFVLNLVISIYVNLDTVMVGFMRDSTAVGYYYGATRLTKLLLGVIGALQTAMIPRFSYLAKAGTMEQFDALCQKVTDFVVTINIPLAVGLFVMSPMLIRLFCGPSYEPAIQTLKILSPIIVLISLSGIAGFQILYPLGQERLAILSTATGAVTNFTLNLLLIPRLAQDGAAIATVVAETVVTVTMFIYGRRYIHLKRFSPHYVNCLFGGVIMFAALWLIYRMDLGVYHSLWLMPLVGSIVYGLYLYIRKDDVGTYLYGVVRGKFQNIQ